MVSETSDNEDELGSSEVEAGTGKDELVAGDADAMKSSLGVKMNDGTATRVKTKASYLILIQS